MVQRYTTRATLLLSIAVLGGCSEQATTQASDTFDLVCNTTRIDGDFAEIADRGYISPKVGDTLRIRISTSPEKVCFDNCSRVYDGNNVGINDQEIRIVETNTIAGRDLPASRPGEDPMSWFVINRANGTASIRVRSRPLATNNQDRLPPEQNMTVVQSCTKESFSGFPEARI